MSDVLANWNAAPLEAAARQILPCCGSKAWAHEMAIRRPFQDEAALRTISDDVWRGLSASDWMEAFNSHPRIGESSGPSPSAERSAAWARQEQEKVADAADALKIALAEGNREYERRFGRIFIVCAMGKSAAELLQILERRLQNDAETELHEAAEQQRQITEIRLRKWIHE